MCVLATLNWQRIESDRVLDEPGLYTDAPVSLQVVGPRFNDGLVLAALNVIERIIKSQVENGDEEKSNVLGLVFRICQQLTEICLEYQTTPNPKEHEFIGH